MDTPIINNLYNPFIFEYIDSNDQSIFPEIWRKVSDFDSEIKDCYLVSNKGRVYNNNTQIFMKVYLDKYGYQFIRLYRIDGSAKTFKLHRLVMICFDYREDFKKYQVNHVNGIKTDNFNDNLEWCTNRENIIHAFDNGLLDKCLGENSSLARMNKDTIIKICEGLEMYLSYEDICKYAGIEYNRNNQKIIRHVLKRESWKRISQNYNFSKEEYDKKLKSSTTIES